MDECSIKSWAEFKDKVAEINDVYGKCKDPALVKHEMKNTILFRGQADYNWPLETTLERYSSSSWTVKRYLELVISCAPQIESKTDQSWGPMSVECVIKGIASNAGYYPVRIPYLRFLIYLRHHGFPSPLLDWTDLPYIAAFFALVDRVKAENAAVFVYIGAPYGVRSAWEGEPYITMISGKVPAHRRHFLQRAKYTICTQIKEELENAHLFVCHENIFQKNSKRQDRLIKIKIPRTERMDFLRRLDAEMNINDYALFLSEESLMKTLAFQKIEEVER